MLRMIRNAVMTRCQENSANAESAEREKSAAAPVRSQPQSSSPTQVATRVTSRRALACVATTSTRACRLRDGATRSRAARP